MRSLPPRRPRCAGGRRSRTRAWPTPTTNRVLAGPRWAALAAAGAHPQRPLWASTGVKDPAYPDTLYVTELVAKDTVNTMPGATLEATADHGVITGDTVSGAYADAAQVLDRLQSIGIDYDDVTALLETEGLDKFEKSWTELLGTVTNELERVAALGGQA